MQNQKSYRAVGFNQPGNLQERADTSFKNKPRFDDDQSAGLRIKSILAIPGRWRGAA
jgi:hypothetical protein